MKQEQIIENQKQKEIARSESSLSTTSDFLLCRKEGLGNQEALDKGDALLVTIDTEVSLSRIPELSGVKFDTTAIAKYNQEIVEAAQFAFGDTNSVVVVQEEPFYIGMAAIMNEACVKAESIGARVVNLDRFVSSPDLIPSQDYTNISVGRMVDGETTSIEARPNEPNLQQQLDTLRRDMQDTGKSSILIVDDGLFDIPCLETYETIFKDFNIAGYYVGIGPYGDGELNTVPYVEERGDVTKTLLPIKNIGGWICSRDFALWGGKLAKNQQSEDFLTVPYFAPFSTGPGDIIPSDKLIPFSQKVLQANQDLIRSLDRQTGRALTFADLQLSGYGLPTSNIGMFRTAIPTESVASYMTECLIQLGSNYPQGNLDATRRPELSPIDPLTRTRLELLNDACGDKLLILVGSSGTGRSTIARELTEDENFKRLPRVTTRNFRSEQELGEIRQISREDFVNKFANSEDADQIVSAVRYAANDQLYGVTLQTLQQLGQLGTDQVGVIEGTGDVLALKQLLPSAKVVMVLPPSIESVGARLTNRQEVSKQARLSQTEREVNDVQSLLPELIKVGLIDLVITNDDLEISVATIIQYLNGKNK